MGEPAIRREGGDITIVTIGATLYRALAAAQELESEHHISAEVIDTRFLNPLNYEKIIASVKKTGKIVLASDASERGSFLHTMASNISQLAFDYLDGPVAVVGARNWITPAAELEKAFFPQEEWIIARSTSESCRCHKPRTSQGTSEILKHNRRGYEVRHRASQGGHGNAPRARCVVGQ